MEDYKEKYEQAMLRMSKWVEGSEITDPKEVAEFVFPELKESKDERIRKAVKEAVEYYWSDDIQARTDIFAWLEKQGEKIDTIENFDTEFEKQVSCLIASVINREHEYNQGYVKWTANALLEYAKHELEKQGEQNPAWSEEDEMMLECVLDKIGDLGTGEMCKDWLKSLKERVQSKQEWSEEDENLFDLLHACVCHCINDPYWAYPKREKVSKEIVPFIKRLKSLKKRMKGE